MAKKKRNPAALPPSRKPAADRQAAACTLQPAQVPGPSSQKSSSASAALPGRVALPEEIWRGDWTLFILTLMMVITVGLGMPHGLMLQDTFKSVVVSFSVLFAALLFFWNLRQHTIALRWHGVMWLPLLLLAYALASMGWSHTYLAAVDAIRWFIFALLLWLGLNTFDAKRLPMLAWGIHIGATLTALWTALQFWTDFSVFPQGPNPASTFANRNFFAEWMVTAIPFSIWLMARRRTSAAMTLMAFNVGFNLVALLMTGTRSALAALLMLTVVMPFILWRYRHDLPSGSWKAREKALVLMVLLVTVIGLGFIRADNPQILQEKNGATALERSFLRATSVTKAAEYTEGSFSSRLLMWKATGRMIAQQPITGVGAGAWQVHIPRYQSEDWQPVIEYYAHNDIIQLIAEYGLVGWLFLLALFAYLLRAAWWTWCLQGDDARREGPLRAVALAGLLSLLMVSNAGFPWHLAATTAMFATLLAILAASDARLGQRGWTAAQTLNGKPSFFKAALVAIAASLALAGYITQQTAACENLMELASRTAIAISRSDQPNAAQWAKPRQEMVEQARQSLAINPHQREISHLVADPLAESGDWRNAIWIWEAVLKSRPYTMSLITNVARGHMVLGHHDEALQWLQRAQHIQPQEPAVKSLEAFMLWNQGKKTEAVRLVREGIDQGRYDRDLIRNGVGMAMATQDYDLAIKAMAIRHAWQPERVIDNETELGYAWFAKGDQARALEHFRAALAATPADQRSATLEKIPQNLRSQLQ